MQANGEHEPGLDRLCELDTFSELHPDVRAILLLHLTFRENLPQCLADVDTEEQNAILAALAEARAGLEETEDNR